MLKSKKTQNKKKIDKTALTATVKFLCACMYMYTLKN